VVYQRCNVLARQQPSRPQRREPHTTGLTRWLIPRSAAAASAAADCAAAAGAATYRTATARAATGQPTAGAAATIHRHGFS
jgi:hypothetical protein